MVVNMGVERAYRTPVILEESCDNHSNFQKKKGADAENVLKAWLRNSLVND